VLSLVDNLPVVYAIINLNSKNVIVWALSLVIMDFCEDNNIITNTNWIATDRNAGDSN